VNSSAEIERELTATRERVSAELDALAYKLDVPSRAKERVGGAKNKLRNAAPDVADVQRTVEQNPLGTVLGGLAAGVLAGLLLPRTKLEDEKVGPVADRIRDEAAATGREAFDRAKQIAGDAADAAKDAAQDSGQEQAEELQETARARLSSVRD
jgi:hypothetical protein